MSEQAVETILHICPRADWQRAQQAGHYRADSLESEGFIHCSRPEQVEKVANSYYPGQAGLVLLHIDVAALEAELRWEASDGDRFPHVYGPIYVGVVTAVEEFAPGPDGRFRYPPDDSQ